MRTDSGQQAAWTPGPWIFDGPDKWADCRVYHQRGGDDRDREPIWSDTNEANGRLIALAPEMAAAILELADCPTLDHASVLAGITDRLRKIGAGARR